MAVTTAAGKLGILAFDESPQIELRSPWTEDDVQTAIRAVYRQVLGNEHVMKSERLSSAESLLRTGNINVREFVRAVAKSELYRTKFLYPNFHVRFIELNFKHLLGRAPYDESEISSHLDLYNDRGYDAEIDSYIDGKEYQDAFGENVVPYYRGFETRNGSKTVGFNRIFSLYRGYANSDRAQFGGGKPRLTASVSQNTANNIIPPSSPASPAARHSGVAGISSGDKLFLVQFSRGSALARGPQVRRDYQVSLVPYTELSSKLQQISKSGGRVISVTSAS